jgi:pimeloyl-ACP methyl ester carboxylesterase
MTNVPAAPTHTGYAETNGTRIYYQVHGDLNSGKTPLLVLHGSYMSAESMTPLVTRFAATRPVIAISQRGHGRTGDAAGAITYELLAGDAAGVLERLRVEAADVLGYSLGGSVALLMALRHPERVGRQVIVAGTYRRDGYYPVVLRALERVTPELFAGGPMEREYKRLSPTPDAFPTLVEKLKALAASPHDWPEDGIRAIKGNTMVIIGDADGVRLEHAVELFKLRGGSDEKTAAEGFMTEAPRARLAILPGTSHVGIMAEAGLIARLVTPFLDDATPVMPRGFFDAPGEQQGRTKR